MNPMNVNASMSPYTETCHQIKEHTTDGPQLFSPTENDPQVSQHTRADSQTISKQAISVSPKIKPNVSDTNISVRNNPQTNTSEGFDGFNSSVNEPLTKCIKSENKDENTFNESDNEPLANLLYHDIESTLDDSDNDSDYRPPRYDSSDSSSNSSELIDVELSDEEIEAYKPHHEPRTNMK
ncbi:unnamed protein product [Owenia fusiformis]|uniref:Uncharacterized protein n=1 Tax=Owenia fusiformis TaxID=6347 RepID=A0A8J1TFL1_OWEFU|nr:unnamed protein product [Owenia fusiformis]